MMKQPKIHITDIHNQDWGMKNVSTVHWNIDGEISSIQIDFMGNQYDLMDMYDIDNTGVFTNTHGNLKGQIIWE